MIIPLEAEYFALRGVALLVETIEKVQDRINPASSLDGILITMFDPRTLHAWRGVPACGRGVPRQGLPHHHQPHREVSTPPSPREPIISFATSNKGAAYRQLARELIRGAAA